MCARTKAQEMVILSGEVTIGIIQEVIFSLRAKNFIDKVKNSSLHLKQVRDQQQPSKEH